MSYAVEILHVCCSANGGGGFKNPWATKLHSIPLYAAVLPYAGGTLGSQLCFIADLLQIEREMTSRWRPGATAPPLIHFVSVAVSPSV